MRASVDLEGFVELDTAFAELPKATGKNVMRRVGRVALEPMAADARRRAPDDPATPPPYDLKSTIIVSEKTSSSVGRNKEAPFEIYMGPTSDGYPQAMVQEFGAGPHYVVKGSGRKRVRMGLEQTDHKMHPGHAPHPYMRPAWDHGAGGLLDRLAAAFAEEIERARARLARKAERIAAKMKRG